MGTHGRNVVMIGWCVRHGDEDTDGSGERSWSLLPKSPDKNLIVPPETGVDRNVVLEQVRLLHESVQDKQAT
jgi:hypothetical protein